MGPYVTTGINSRGVRVELYEFVKNKEQFSLLVQALQIMQDGPGTNPYVDPASYVNIGGIHGLPYTKWPGDSSSTELTGAKLGYCVHGMNLFPTWHRPYVALYEQILQGLASNIADNYTVEQDKWKQAAANFRLPYWDWACPNSACPPYPFIGGDTVTIVGFDGKETDVANPLRGSTFPPVPGSSHPLAAKGDQSTRSTRGDNDDPEKFKNAFDSNQGIQLQAMVKRLFETPDMTWDSFSHHILPDMRHQIVPTNNLEAIHDTVHGTIGGWQSDPSTSGYDPIFFFHHCNVDRLLAIWQVLNPHTWVSKGDSGDGTGVIPKGSSVDVNTGLAPFWSSSATLFRSSDVQDWSQLGYEYADFFAPWIDRADPESVKRGIHKRISELYGMFDPTVRNYIHLDNPQVVEAVKASVNEQQVEVVLDKLAAAFLSHQILEPSDTEVFKPHRLDYYEWAVRIRVKHYALGESFSVNFYLDPASDDVHRNELGPSYVGSYHTFVNSNSDTCANCQNQGDPLVGGVLYLNHKIAERSGLNSFNPDKILAWISGKLAWRVKRASGVIVPLQEIPSLEVTIVSTRLELEAGATVPMHGDFHIYPVDNAGL